MSDCFVEYSEDHVYEDGFNVPSDYDVNAAILQSCDRMGQVYLTLRNAEQNSPVYNDAFEAFYNNWKRYFCKMVWNYMVKGRYRETEISYEIESIVGVMLVKAARSILTWNPSDKASLETYIKVGAQHAMWREVENIGKDLFGSPLDRAKRKVGNVVSTIAKERGINQWDVSDEEVSEYTYSEGAGMTVEYVRAARREYHFGSLSARVSSNEDNGLLLSDILADEDENVVDEVFLDVDFDFLRQAIERLSSKSRDCVHLFYFEGKTQFEIVDILGISQATVSKILKQSREKLYHILINDFGMLEVNR